MGSPLPLLVLAGVLGLAIGSFLNVVIYRVPRNESIVTPASRCPSCDATLKPWHNVPVVSWLALRGKCAFCGTQISARYPLVEAGTAVLFIAMTLRFGLHLELPAYLFLVAVGLTLALIDVDMQRLPNAIVLPSYVVAVSLLMPAGAVNGDWRSAVRALAGMAALAAIYFALSIVYPHGLDGGDVKVAGFVGLYLGWISWSAVLVGAIGALVIGAVGGSVLSLLPAGRAERSGRAGRDGATLAFAPCLVASAVLTLFIA
ncbi:MAG: prepilin peptidase, partial [Sciscionella sp.]